MCKYCETDCIIRIIDIVDTGVDFDTTDTGAMADINFDGQNFSLSVAMYDIYGEEIIREGIPLHFNYCPMCGKKLENA